MPATSVPGGGEGRRLNSTSGMGTSIRAPVLMIVEVVMRVDVRIEPRARAVHRKLPDQSALGKKIQRVIDRSLRDAGARGAQAIQNLLGGKMLRCREEQGCNAHTLPRRSDTAVR